jgi:hypothetical protein
VYICVKAGFQSEVGGAIVSHGQVKAGMKVVALMLMVPGVFGVGLGLWTLGQTLRESGLIVVPVLIFAVYGWSAWTGVGLWRQERWAFVWATILLIAQMPMVIVPGFVYRFYLGLNFTLVLQQDRTLDFKCAAGAWLQLFDPSGEGFGVGLNIVPIVILLYLLNAHWPSTEETRSASA